ncbi:MAG: lipooligosaccharide transport system permease protein [Baekduia sp.]|nr:lipooligosaccharide transport system permease protein [Baekduia sp.]
MIIFDTDDDPQRPFLVTLTWEGGVADTYRWASDGERAAAMREFGHGPHTRRHAAQTFADTLAVGQSVVVAQAGSVAAFAPPSAPSAPSARSVPPTPPAAPVPSVVGHEPVRRPPHAAPRAPRQAGTRRAQLPRLDAVAIGGVMSRELTVFTRTWRSTTFSAVVEPTIFLLAFGLGFGALISQVRGVDYMEFVGTGVVATTVVFSSAFPAMYSTWIKSRFQHIYDAVLATPVNVKDLVTAEVLWIALRTGVYAIAPLGVAVAYGMRPGWGIVAVPFIAFLTGFGFAAFGVTVAAMAKAITNFSFIISGLLTPLLLLAGAYFPVSFLPPWARTLNEANPLFHCVELVRDAVFGFNVRRDLVHAAALLLFGGVMWWLAVQRLRPVLID